MREVQEDFNPHEREARDVSGIAPNFVHSLILIHTSVKLVTNLQVASLYPLVILIHTSVKLVTSVRGYSAFPAIF